jgi:superfamily I DNA/RNA helicase
VLDVADCAVYFLRMFKSVEEASSQVSSLFKDNGDGITLSSIHKAKGLEAHRVVIVNYKDMPMRTRTNGPDSRS